MGTGLKLWHCDVKLTYGCPGSTVTPLQFNYRGRGGVRKRRRRRDYEMKEGERE